MADAAPNTGQPAPIPTPLVPWPHVDVVAIFALVALIGLMVLIGMLMFVSIPKENQQLAGNVIVLFAGIVVSIAAYYFGSSKGSSAKDQTLAVMATTAATNANKDG